MGDCDARKRMGARLLATAIVLMAGCQHFQLPAIDPTGERIFSSTETARLAAPSDSRCLSNSLFPRPAWEQPLTPPPCPQPAPLAPPVAVTGAGPPPPTAPVRTVENGIPGAIRITPTRMIAPVGSEVVLLGGLCGEDGYLVTCQPIEWLLSQDSVGQFVEVSDQESFWTRSKKLSANYAITRTSHRGQIVTRGTPSVTDDIVQQKGQCWVSLTSASEGTSYVTAVASTGAVWPQRRQSATIYWVDAQWALPNPVAVSAGQSHTLSTSVTRTATNAPAVGYLVRYEVIDGTAAVFAPGGTAAVEVPTDANGIAAAVLQPPSNLSGVTQVRIEIIRPADPSSDAPRTKLGEGFTSITWSAPGLALRGTGPNEATLGAVLTYRFEVHNPGDIPARDVVVRDIRPPTLQFVSSAPTPQIFGDRAEWRLGDLPARSVQSIEVQLRADAGGGVRYAVNARSADGLHADAFVDTQISRPSLTLNVTGPSTATVDERIQFRIEVVNSGDQPLLNITVTDRFDAGLEHTEKLASPIQKVIERLEPGGNAQFAVGFLVRRAGQICHVVEAGAPGADSVRQQICLNAGAPAASPQPGLRVTKTAVPEAQVGQSVAFSTTVTNTGNVPLTNVRIADSYDPALEPRESTAGWDPSAWGAGQLVWVVGTLTPGESTRRDVLCVGRKPVEAAVSRATVTSDEGVLEEARAVVRILPASPAPPGVEPPPKPPSTATGNLVVDILEFGDPLKMGDQTAYVITIRNDRPTADQDVVLTIEFPPGLRFEKLSGPVARRNVSADGRTVRVSPIHEVRPGETLPAFRVEATGVQVGDHTMRVVVSGRLSPQGVAAEETTTVFSQ